MPIESLSTFSTNNLEALNRNKLGSQDPTILVSLETTFIFLTESNFLQSISDAFPRNTSQLVFESSKEAPDRKGRRMNGAVIDERGGSVQFVDTFDTSEGSAANVAFYDVLDKFAMRSLLIITVMNEASSRLSADR